MGIHNRDYMRDESRSFGLNRRGGRAYENIVTKLIVVNVVFFLAQMMIMGPPSLEEFRRVAPIYYNIPVQTTEAEFREFYEQEKHDKLFKRSVVEAWCLLDPQKVMQGQVWRLLTYAFLHSTESPYHILFNMLILYMAGNRLQYQLGTREFLWFYLAACVASAFMFLVWGAFTGSLNPALGASGGVSAVMMVYALHWPNERWLMMMIFPMPVMGIVLLYAAFDLLPMLQQLGGGAPKDNIAHAAHMGGLVFGFLYFRNRWRVGDWIPVFPSLKSLRRKPKLKVHTPNPEPTAEKKPIPPDVSARVDQILAKITEQGEASLSNEEREYLAEASRKFRERS